MIHGTINIKYAVLTHLKTRVSKQKVVTQTRSCSAVIYFAFTTRSKLDKNISNGSKYHKAPRGVLFTWSHSPPPVLYTGTYHSPFIPKSCFPNYITGSICRTKIFEKLELKPERKGLNILVRCVLGWRLEAESHQLLSRRLAGNGQCAGNCRCHFYHLTLQKGCRLPT